MTAQLKAVPEPPKPRGQAASESTIALYQLLFEADHPLTFAEILDKLPSAFRSHAYEEFKKDQRAQLVPIRDDGWTKDESDAAWSWWVVRLIQASANNNRIIVGTRDGTSTRGKRRDQLVYTANQSSPPMVHRRVVVDKLERWTPEYGSIGRQHAVTMQTVADVRRLLKSTKDDDLRSLLERVIQAMKP